MAVKLEWLKAVELGGTSMSYSDTELFLKNDLHFPADTSACTYQLAAHSLLVNVMLGEHSTFAVTYHHCMQALQSHLLLSLCLHYGNEAYMVGLRMHPVLAHSAIPVLPVAMEAQSYSPAGSL